MAAIVGESPEESPDVPEADLSMELQDQLKRCLTEHESGCAKEEAHVRRSEPGDQGEKINAAIEKVREKYAEAAVLEMVTTLKSFDPEISKEKLSNDIYRILHSDAVVGHLNPQLKGALRKYVPRCRKDWLADDIERHIAAKRAQLRIIKEKVGKMLSICRAQALQLAGDPTARVVLLSGGGGAVVLGASGGALGLASGVAAGTLVGVVPAPLTFGLSIPAGASVGGGLGACTGTVSGATMGLLGGGVAGGVAYTYNVEIKDGVVHAKKRALATASAARTKALETTSYLKVSAIDATDCARQRVSSIARSAVEGASDAGAATVRAARETNAKAVALLHDHAFQASAASAAAGAAIAGAGGGALGLVTGGAVGAACGIVPAIFTFGLSIPIGAAIGSGAGFGIGASAGGTAGFIGGGAAGYGIYTRRADICTVVDNVRARARSLADMARDTAGSSLTSAPVAEVGHTS